MAKFTDGKYDLLDEELDRRARVVAEKDIAWRAAMRAKFYADIALNVDLATAREIKDRAARIRLELEEG